MQARARIPPGDVDALRLQEPRADLGRHQFAGGHHARARAVAELAQSARMPCATCRSSVKWRSQLRADADAQFGRQLQVTLLDRGEQRLMRARQRRSEQLLQPVGDAADAPNARPARARRRRAASRTTAAMLRQLARVETLVPPNFSTIQRALAKPSKLVVFEGVAQVFLELAVGQHLFQLLQAALPRLPWLRTRLSTRASMPS